MHAIWLAAATLGMLGPSEGTNPAPGAPRPYLNMPRDDRAPLPPLLSQTGAFTDTASLTPSDGLLPYEINAPFWSDGAGKRRWIAVPAGDRIAFSADGEWIFPAGTVFIKHFAWPHSDTCAPSRLETRLLVRDQEGGVYGTSYRWREDGRDADLVTEARTEAVPGEPGRTWFFPGPRDCRTCHTPAA